MGSTDAPIRAGLIYQRREQAERLKQTLAEAGIALTVELDVAALRDSGLDDDNVEVYIVNLEAEIEDLLDEVTELLDATSRPVVYNDADVSSDLSGWDQARWARHLAAKIRKERGLLPPTPVGAEAIPAPRRAEPVPEPAKADRPAPESLMPADVPAAPVADASAEQATEAAAEAFVEPAAEAAPEPSLESTTDTDEAPSSGLLDLSLELLDEGPPPPSLAEAEASTGSEAGTDSVEENLDIASWSLDEVEEAPAPADEEVPASDVGLAELDSVQDEEAQAPTQELVLGEDLGLSIDLPELEPDQANDESEFVPAAEDLGVALDLPDEVEPDATAAAPLEAVDELDDLSLFAEPAAAGEDSLEATELPSGDDHDTVVDDLDSLFGEVADLAEDAADADVDVDLGEVGIELQEELVELDLDEPNPASALPDESVPDLDELFASSSEKEPASEAPEESAAAPRSPGLSLPDISEWVLEPLDELDDTPVREGPTETVGLDLRDLDRKAPPPPFKPAEAAPAAPAAPAPAPASGSQSKASASSEGGLESLDLDLGIDFAEMDLVSEPEAPAAPSAPESVQSMPAEQAAAPTAAAGPRRVVILGASIGGPDSIRSYLKAIRADLDAAFVLVQHMGAEFLELMAQQLDRVTPLQVHLANHGAKLKEGEVLVAPVGKRLRFDDKGVCDLSQEAGNTAYSPSIDQVLADSLERWGAERLLVIIFSGMANDAVTGARQLAGAGVPIWAQDPASCVISSMVDGVVAAKVVSFIGTPEQLAEQTNRLLA